MKTVFVPFYKCRRLQLEHGQQNRKVGMHGEAQNASMPSLKVHLGSFVFARTGFLTTLAVCLPELLSVDDPTGFC